MITMFCVFFRPQNVTQSYTVISRIKIEESTMVSTSVVLAVRHIKLDFNTLNTFYEL